MIPTRHYTYAAIALAALLAAWLLQSGHWRTLAARLPALVPGEARDRLLADAGGEAAATGEQPPDIRRWTDENGITHFGDAADAPAGADAHRLGKTTTLADHIESLESSDVTMEALYRKQQERQREEAEAARAGTGDAMLDATQQARELQQRQREALEAIRAENNR